MNYIYDAFSSAHEVYVSNREFICAMSAAGLAWFGEFYPPWSQPAPPGSGRLSHEHQDASIKLWMAWVELFFG
jgi:hypothetical protein